MPDTTRSSSTALQGGSLRLNWLNTSFLVATHVVAVGGTAAWLALRGPSWAAVGLLVFFLAACGFSITAGYHRLFSHRAFEAHPALRAVMLFFGAGQFENSALSWSLTHRRHHAEVDRDGDPYNIQKGFWWAHVGWVLFHDDSQRELDPKGHPDLTSDPLVMLQHRFYVPIGVTAGLLLPWGLGALMGDAWGGLLLGGFVRLVLLYHSTFCVNSVAHWIGAQPYSEKDSSRDSFVTALLSMGEGYHNYHHRFPVDYRNGVRAWHYDPTKWGIRLLSFVGLARRLRRIPAPLILKTRLAVQARQAQRATEHPRVAEALESAHAGLERLVDRWGELRARAAEMRRRKDRDSRTKLVELRREMNEVRSELRTTIRRWRAALRQPELLAGS